VTLSSQEDENKFTQVYGFGHWDPNEEGTFLSISLDRLEEQTTPTNKNHNRSNHTLLVLEISTRHLVMIEKKKNTFLCIPASKIMVGDILRPCPYKFY
jgi:hypothetical protein